MEKFVQPSEFDLVLPDLPRPAWIADAAVNIAGVILSVLGAAALPVLVLKAGQPELLVPAMVYGLSLVMSFTASAAYNSGPYDALRPLLRRFDHAAIYLKIAGTTTTYAALTGTALAWGVLALTWTCAIAGMVRKIVFWGTPGRLDPYCYLALAWTAAIPLYALWGVVPDLAMALICFGGLVYTFGVRLYLARFAFSRAAWHLSVLVAASCFYAAFVLGVIG